MSLLKEKVVYIIKKVINKSQSFSWIVDIDALSYIINKITFFDDFLIRIKKRID